MYIKYNSRVGHCCRWKVGKMRFIEGNLILNVDKFKLEIKVVYNYPEIQTKNIYNPY